MARSLLQGTVIRVVPACRYAWALLRLRVSNGERKEIGASRSLNVEILSDSVVSVTVSDSVQ